MFKALRNKFRVWLGLDTLDVEFSYSAELTAARISAVLEEVSDLKEKVQYNQTLTKGYADVEANRSFNNSMELIHLQEAVARHRTFADRLAADVKFNDNRVDNDIRNSEKYFDALLDHLGLEIRPCQDFIIQKQKRRG